MADADMYELKFVWPHTGPKSVVVSGTFNKWSRDLKLTKTSTGFETTVKVPWNQKVKYKFLIDGYWALLPGQPTEMDPGGYINNVLMAPPKPEPTPPAPEVPTVLPPDDSVKTNGHAAANGEGKINNEQAALAVGTTGLPQLLSDLANTIVARDGTSSALGYVASGIGAAMHSVVGVDPINLQKISIPTPISDQKFMLPGPENETAPNIAVVPPSPAPPPASTSESKQPTSPVAPIIPMIIVPVNAPENNTIGKSPAHDGVLATPLPLPGAAPAGAVQEVAKPATAADKAEEDKSTPAAVVPNAEAPVVSEIVTADPTAAEKTEEVAAPTVPEKAPVKVEDVAPTDTTVAVPIIEAVKTEVPSTVEEVTPEVKKDETSATAEVPAEKAPEQPAPVAAEPTPIPASSAPNGTKSEVEASAATTESKPSTDTSAPTTNGRSTPPHTASTLAAPVTPNKHQRFPSFSLSRSRSRPSSIATNDSPSSSSKFGSARKKRGSIIEKIKDIFHHDKDGKEKEKEKVKK